MRGDEEGVEEGLSLCVGGIRAQRIKVYELSAEAEDGFVEHVVELDGRAQARALAQTKLARDVEVEEKERGAAARVARQVAGLSDGRERERGDERGVEWFTGLARAQAVRVAVEGGPIIVHIVEVAIHAEREIEGRARSEAQDRSEAQTRERTRQIEDAGEDEAMPSVGQA